eukprot:CAMPEP_0201690282 /NCGR_PEP_ID=MMETSP0578-20130828/3744_1 /ASSEMBLY_ACC=CAM_ASM_000663 /TAXON_ID=267565 /ORGANISM="Skeletonema grethea, Strain CCMP 1804" /LENGTH=869 /DNA_ID=CAMNT_0048175215 /DNA_START=87 /DNA_END=2696 /DNA_ORIENTATION=-
MSPPTNQQSLDAAAFLKNYVLAQQQHQSQSASAQGGSAAAAVPPPLPPVPAQAPQEANHAVSLQQLIAATQQQRPGSNPLPQLDPNTARLVVDALNAAKQQQPAGAPPAAAAPPGAPPPPFQQTVQPSFGSVDSTSAPTAAVPPQQHHQQNLLASAHLLGSLNPAIAAALMTSALQQSAGVTNLPFSPSQHNSQGTLNSQQAPEKSKSSSTALSNAPSTAPGGASTTFPPPAMSAAASLTGQAPPPLSIMSAPTGGPPVASLHHHYPQQQKHRPPPPNHPITKMQRWSLEQLESHAKELQDGGYQLPQAVAILLNDARRKEEKRVAKRIANRKSACTSRARKKAQIDQLMNENAQLRRLEVILSHLPDPVIVISPQGVITFCSMQLERVFKHKVSDLVGANIEDLMIPRSRGVIRKLIRDMLVAEQELSDPSVNGNDAKKSAGGDISGGSDGHPFGNLENASESAFPLLEVKVNSTQVDAGEDVSDSDENRRHSPNGKKSSQAAATEISSLTHKGSSFNSNEVDDATPPLKEAKVDTNGKKMNSSESDESSDQRNANANLPKNVEACKLNKDKNVEVRFSHKDDVMGAYVTANNADAKLSSLMHEPSLKAKHTMGPADKQEEQCSSTMDSSLTKTSSEKAQAKKGNSSEDSGYREGGESPEDSNSSSSCASIEIASLTRRRARPMAPSRNVCLIRSDLSTIWCEMTSSVRTSMPPDDADRGGSVSKEGSVQEQEEFQKEILLCFRPIQEGEKVSSDLRFWRVLSQEKQSDGSGSGSNPKIPGVSESSGGSGGGSGSNNDGANTSNGADPSSAGTQTDVDGSMQLKKNRPLKKRALDIQESAEVGNKKSRPAETSAVETMMELAKNTSFP